MKYENKWHDPNYVFEYDQSSPSCLRWKNHKTKKSLVGAEAGHIGKNPATYRVYFKGKIVPAHTVIWEMFHGQFDNNDTIKFLDGDRLNPCIDNLCLVKKKDKNWQDKYISKGDLQKAFSYREGKLYWKGDRYNGANLKSLCSRDGDELFSTKTLNNYLTTCILSYSKHNILYHRLVYEYFNGKIPQGMEIDHINGDRSDNRIENLRLVTKDTNCRNNKLSCANTTGKTGVHIGYSSNKNVKYYVASWVDANGNKNQKMFSCNKLGESTAFSLACQKRDAMIEEVNTELKERGYHKNHGNRC